MMNRERSLLKGAELDHPPSGGRLRDIAKPDRLTVDIAEPDRLKADIFCSELIIETLQAGDIIKKDLNPSSYSPGDWLKRPFDGLEEGYSYEEPVVVRF